MLIAIDQLHLTRLNGLVQLRTQFHHLDASAQLEAVNRRREKESQEGAKPAEPKTFLPTVKKAGGDTAAEMTQAFMKSANQETWHKLNYADEDVGELVSLTYTDTDSNAGEGSVRYLQRPAVPGRPLGCSQASLEPQQQPVPGHHQRTL